MMILDCVHRQALTARLMTWLPLVHRELRVAFRKQRPAQGRLKIAALASAGSVLFMFLGALPGNQRTGVNLEQLLCLVGLYCVLRVPLLTSAGLAAERHNQTLGLLFLSGLGAWEVFAGKFLSSALVAFTNLLAICPMLAVPFLIGGVSFKLFLATVCALPTLMLLALAISLLASVLAGDEGSAIVLTFVLLALLCLLTPVLYTAQTHFAVGAKPSLWWWRLSPAYAPYLIWTSFSSGFSTGQWGELWQNLGLTLSWAMLALLLAVLLLNRLWRAQATPTPEPGWRERWHSFLHGGYASRRRLARYCLDANPFAWLAGRDRQSAILAWLAIGGIVVAWLACWAAWPATWPSTQNFFISATLLNFVLAWFTRQYAAGDIGQARRDGVYELLLTTPVDTRDIVWGTLLAVRRQFRSLKTAVLLINFCLLWGGLFLRHWNAGAFVVYLIIWLVLLNWTWSIGRGQLGLLRAMWISLNCGRPAYAVWRSSGLNTWSWIWIFFNLQSLSRQFQRFPTGSPAELVAVGFAGIVLLIMWLSRLFWDDAASGEDLKWDVETSAWTSRRVRLEPNAFKFARRMAAEFREIVREPLPDPTDPRFKKWDVNERFPWGWEVVQHQLHERLARRLAP